MNAAVATDFDTLATTATATPRVATRTHVTLNRLHPSVLGIGAGAYVAMIAAFWVGFSNPSVVFGISFGIVLVCLAAFLGLPYLMGRDGKKFWEKQGQPEAPMGTFRQFLNSKFETADGTVTGAGALALVATVPVCLAFGVIAMAIIRHTV